MTSLSERGQPYMAPRWLPTVRGFEQLDRLLHAFEPRLTGCVTSSRTWHGSATSRTDAAARKAAGRCARCFLAALLFSTSVAQAEPLPGAAHRGDALAHSLCSGCHVVAPGQAGSVVDAVPSFAELAQHSDDELSNALIRLGASSHPPMPALPLDRDQTADIAAYIRSQRAAPDP